LFSRALTIVCQRREAGARLFYFENVPEEERAKAELLNKVTKAPAGEISVYQPSSKEAESAGVYPLGNPTIDFFNSLELLVEFVQAVTQANVNADMHIFPEVPEGSQVQFPTPDRGLVKLTEADVKKYFGRFDPPIQLVDEV
jgi:hypothetical protein